MNEPNEKSVISKFFHPSLITLIPVVFSVSLAWLAYAYESGYSNAFGYTFNLNNTSIGELYILGAFIVITAAMYIAKFIVFVFILCFFARKIIKRILTSVDLKITATSIFILIYFLSSFLICDYYGKKLGINDLTNYQHFFKGALKENCVMLKVKYKEQNNLITFIGFPIRQYDVGSIYYGKSIGNDESPHTIKIFTNNAVSDETYACKDLIREQSKT